MVSEGAETHEWWSLAQETPESAGRGGFLGSIVDRGRSGDISVYHKNQNWKHRPFINLLNMSCSVRILK
jgi:hypothetical protein